MTPSRVRYSLETLEKLYSTGQDRSKLENLIRAFRGIQALDPTDPDSFFCIAGYHGEPFRQNEGPPDPNYWGGYCWHGSALFPTWHRAYVLRIENALRGIPGCQDVTLPYWDELANIGAIPPRPIPKVLTSPTFELDGRTDNPLYSYKLQQALVDNEDTGGRYTKNVGYEVVRYPLAGLVGTEKDREQSTVHNSKFPSQEQRTQILNDNVAAWLEGTVVIPDDETNTRRPDTYSVAKEFKLCLEAPNFTVFSNTTSQDQWIKDAKKPLNSHYVVALEAPHNSIHLAVGGFYQKGELNANPIYGANGDMGDNQTAGFDPIFFFHHCWIDYTFSIWQQSKNLTKRGSLTLMNGYAGTILEGGQPGYPKGTVITMSTELIPFKKPDGSYYTSDDVTDFENDLDYSYDIGSLHAITLGTAMDSPAFILKTPSVSRADYVGSFVIRVYAKGKDGKEIEVGRRAVLSRHNLKGCQNCQTDLKVSAIVPIDQALCDSLKGSGSVDDIEYHMQIQTRDGLGGEINSSVGEVGKASPEWTKL